MHQPPRRARWMPLSALLVFTITACTDSATPTAPPIDVAPSASRSQGRGVFQRYVAIGTSVSMAYRSRGVNALSQVTSWPAQLSRLAGREMTQPYISGPGCPAPFATPLVSFKRINGESVTIAPDLRGCSPLLHGVTLPAQNVAVNAARTSDALFTTPENVVDPDNVKLYPRVLPPGQTQVRAMMSQNPKIVSVELGSNEVLGALGGVIVPGNNVVPFASWQPLYDAVLDSVEKVTRMAVLVTLPTHSRDFPALRSGAELAHDAAAFLSAFNVQIDPECGASASQNYVTVPYAVVSAVGNGLARRQAGLSPFVLSCTNQPFPAADFILTPTDLNNIDAMLAAMNAHIVAEAQERGFAVFSFDVLYARSDVKPPFSVVTLMNGALPYGPFISFDGLHPSALGSSVLALAAARALNDRYHLGILDLPIFLGVTAP